MYITWNIGEFKLAIDNLFLLKTTLNVPIFYFHIKECVSEGN